MSALEHAVAPGAQKVAVAVEHDHRMLAAGEAIELVFIVNRHRRHFVKRPVIGQFAETFDHFITKITAANNNPHESLLI